MSTVLTSTTTRSAITSGDLPHFVSSSFFDRPNKENFLTKFSFFLPYWERPATFQYLRFAESASKIFRVFGDSVVTSSKLRITEYTEATAKKLPSSSTPDEIERPQAIRFDQRFVELLHAMTAITPPFSRSRGRSVSSM